MLVFKEEGDLLKGAYFIINKPIEWTSFDVVKKLKFTILKHFKGQLKKIKIGHTGTLDPLATGVIIVCTGKYTKRIEEFKIKEKEYIAELKLGATTPCDDAELPEDTTYSTTHISKTLILEQLPKFLGKIMQKPPAFSAVRVDGKRAYKLARKGTLADIKAREVEIMELELLAFNPPFVKLRVVCGAGTYIRSLARDLGKSLDSGAYLTNLVRTRVGQFKITEASSIDDSVNRILDCEWKKDNDSKT